MATKISTNNAQESETEKRAKAFQATLPNQKKTFYKVMLKSHVRGGFWFGLPASFCKKNLPAEDLQMKLVENESGEVSESTYLSYKKGLSAGWRGFATTYKLVPGNVLVFQLVASDKFQVYIFKDNQNNPIAAKEIVPSKENMKIDVHAVRCGKCYKMRFFKTCREFEKIRSVLQSVPFYCDMKHGVSCEDKCDLKGTPNVIMVVDKPGLPVTPEGFSRHVEVRSDLSGCNIYYTMPNGDEIRSFSELKRFFDAHPEYKKSVSLLDFTFTAPVVRDYQPENEEMKKKRIKSK